MTTPLQFAGKMRLLANTIPEKSLPAGVRTAAELVKSTIEAGSPKTLRNVGSSGASIGAYVEPLKTTGDGATARVRARGAFHLVEHSIREHLIEPRGVRALVVPVAETGFATRAQHPGVQRSSGPFERGVRAAAPQVPRIIHKLGVDAPLRAVI